MVLLSFFCSGFVLVLVVEETDIKRIHYCDIFSCHWSFLFIGVDVLLFWWCRRNEGLYYIFVIGLLAAAVVESVLVVVHLLLFVALRYYCTDRTSEKYLLF